MRLRTSFLVSDRTAALISFSRPVELAGVSGRRGSSAVASSVAALRSALAAMVMALASSVGADLGDPVGHVVAVVDAGRVRRCGVVDAGLGDQLALQLDRLA